MVIPENSDNFEEFAVDGFRVFIEKQLLSENPKEIEFLIASTGNFKIEMMD